MSTGEVCNPFASHLYLFFSSTVQNEHNYTVMRGYNGARFSITAASVPERWGALSEDGPHYKHSQLIKTHSQKQCLSRCHELHSYTRAGCVWGVRSSYCLGVYKCKSNTVTASENSIPFRDPCVLDLIAVIVIGLLHTAGPSQDIDSTSIDA